MLKIDENITNEFSFILKPAQYGVGVFATHKIKKGTYLRLFGDESKLENRSIIRKTEDVPEFFQQFCMSRGKTLICPQDFGHMQIGWYVNHSKKNPNAAHKNYNWYAIKNIEAGEEILVDYNSLEEPEEVKEKYYYL